MEYVCISSEGLGCGEEGRGGEGEVKGPGWS